VRRGLYTVLMLAVSALAQTKQAGVKDFTIQTAQPILIGDFTKPVAYVVGTDFKIRTCPDGYGVYVRPEGQKPDNPNFMYVVPGTKLFPTLPVHWTMICVQVKP
jgi:hypothetical protein